MANNVIGLYDDSVTADQVVSDLLASGFNERNISRFQGDQEDLAAELENAGVAGEEATYYVERLRGGGALVAVRANDDHVDQAVDILNRYAGDDLSDTEATAAYGADGSNVYDTNGGSSEATADASANAYPATDTVPADSSSESVTSDADEARLAVAEERLQVGKRTVQHGGKRVRRVVTELPVEEQVVLRDETVRVDRRPVDQAVTAGDTDLFTEQTFEFTETGEEAVAAKEAHVVEEVVVGKQVEEHTETVRDTVRRSDVEVEDISPGANEEDYGYALASDTRFRDRDWDDAEADIRADWESRNQGSWDDNRDSVRASWDRARNRL